MSQVPVFSAQAALARVIEHREIFHEEMVSLMEQIMSGEVSPVMIAAIITGLRVKKETIGEIAAAASVMRKLSTKVPLTDTTALVDTCVRVAMGRIPLIFPRRQCLSRQQRGREWQNMAGGQCRVNRAVPMSWKPWGQISTCNPSKSPPVSPPRA